MNNHELQISDKVKSIPEALSIYINQIVYDQKRKGKDIVVLSLGEAFFDIPMFDFAKLDFVKGYHYSDSLGIPSLRKKIADFYNKEYGTSVNYENEILISTGSKPIIYFAIQSILNPGDELLIHEPGWLSYKEQAKIAGVNPLFIPYDCEIQDFNNYFTDKTKMLVINNPNNPAGRLYTRDELLMIYEQCRPRGIYVLVDEAYSDFIIDEPFYSMANVVPDKDGVIIVNSLSKNMGMSGWRVGYIIAKENVIQNVLKLNQHIITCASTILQYYMAEYFEDIISITLPQVKDVVRKRQRISNMMDELNIKKMNSNSTFYFFVDVESFPGSTLDFALHMLLFNQVAVVPGSAYGESTKRFIRVGIGTESEERIYEALLMIKDLINAKNYDSSIILKKIEKEGLHLFEDL